MPNLDGMGPPWWHGRLKGCGYRITIGRQAILDILAAEESHLSAEDIYTRIRKACPGIGLTTVYRTIDILNDMGLVHRLDFGDGRSRYELAEGPKKRHHHHLICTGCNKAINYTDFIEEEIKLLKETEKGLSKKYKFRITGHRIEFYGLCERCAGRKGE